tara:strand:- start:101 stop:370 length:270 start_codon:yes stop_codon:yes gene_type:complete
MTIGETVRKALKELSEGILGMIGPKDFTLDDGCCGGKCKKEVKPKRARTKKGRYKADDPKTKDYNEAYVGGKAPKKLLGLKKKKTRKKK